MTQTPSVFVSSTFYDLKQIRADLREFIISLGLQPVFSEYDSFPIDPALNAVENCLKVVDENADILVLIIGSRYGSIKNSKSVTNMEYLKARSKGIPIYVFVEKSILNLLPVWSTNPGGNFSAVVDNTRLFEFVKSVREVDAIWTLPFETAQDIVTGLRKQFAYLFFDSLNYRRRFKVANIPPELSHLVGRPLQLVLERPDHWEHLLFGTGLSDEIKRVKQLEWDLTYGVMLGSSIYLRNPAEVRDWVLTKLAEGTRITSSFTILINEVLPEALGPPGVSGDPVKIVYVCRRIGEAYRATLDWAREVKRVSAPDEFQKLISIFGGFLRGVTKKIEDLSVQFLQNLELAMVRGEAEGGTQVIEMTVSIDLEGVDELNEEMDRLKTLGAWRDL